MKYLTAVVNMIVAIFIAFFSEAAGYNPAAAGIINLIADYFIAVSVDL